MSAHAPLAVLPEEAALALRDLGHLAWLDSAGAPDDDPALGRYSFVAAGPRWVLAAAPGGLVLRAGGGRARRLAGSVFDVIERLGARSPAGTFADGPAPACIGYLGYELGHEVVPPRPGVQPPAPRLPRAWLGCYDAVYRYDHLAGQGEVIGREPARQKLAERLLGAARAARRLRAELGAPPRLGPLTSDLRPAIYCERVRTILEHIAKGDVYQVNLTQRLRAPLLEGGDALALYLRLRELSPAPFGAFLACGDFEVLSNSPERMLLCTPAGRLESRPIKGTRPRAPEPTEDGMRRAELCADAKERAEHVMIVDLVRNDLGQVARPGSVRVDALLRAETYANVHHLVSVVAATRRDGVGLGAALRAVYPGGSITGAPKRRAVELIARLEPSARGVYCGAIGWIGPGGSCDLSVAIRTAVLTAEGLELGVGGGVVADSQPTAELAESFAKASAFAALLAELRG